MASNNARSKKDRKRIIICGCEVGGGKNDLLFVYLDHMSLRDCGYKVKGCRLRRLGALQLAVKRYGIISVNERLLFLGRFHPVMLQDINEIYPEPDDTNHCYLRNYGYGLKYGKRKRLRAILKAMSEHGERTVGDRLMMLGQYHPVMIEDLEDVCSYFSV